MQKLDCMCMNRLMFILFRLDVPSIARKIFPANLMALLATTLLGEARRHQHISYEDVESLSCSLFGTRLTLAGDIGNYTEVKNRP